MSNSISSDNNIYFTSDQHFFHCNILKYCNRPFSNVEEMNETIITNWNNVVEKGDIVYNLGDMFLGKKEDAEKILKRLNGQIHFIQGNHDSIAEQMKTKFASWGNLREIKIKDEDAKDGLQHITLCHYAMRTWHRQNIQSFHLYGHSHQALIPVSGQLSFDVGVDGWNYTPISYQQVKEKMKQIKETANISTSS